MPIIIDNLELHISKAVAHYWQTRKAQRERQQKKEYLMQALEVR